MQACRFALVTRAEDHQLADSPDWARTRSAIYASASTKPCSTRQRHDRANLEAHYDIPPDRIVVLFVGRVDIGKKYLHTDRCYGDS